MELLGTEGHCAGVPKWLPARATLMGWIGVDGCSLGVSVWSQSLGWGCANGLARDRSHTGRVNPHMRHGSTFLAGVLDLRQACLSVLWGWEVTSVTSGVTLTLLLSVFSMCVGICVMVLTLYLSVLTMCKGCMNDVVHPVPLHTNNVGWKHKRVSFTLLAVCRETYTVALTLLLSSLGMFRGR